MIIGDYDSFRYLIITPIDITRYEGQIHGILPDIDGYRVTRCIRRIFLTGVARLSYTLQLPGISIPLIHICISALTRIKNIGSTKEEECWIYSTTKKGICKNGLDLSNFDQCRIFISAAIRIFRRQPDHIVCAISIKFMPYRISQGIKNISISKIPDDLGLDICRIGYEKLNTISSTAFKIIIEIKFRSRNGQTIHSASSATQFFRYQIDILFAYIIKIFMRKINLFEAVKTLFLICYKIPPIEVTRICHSH